MFNLQFLVIINFGRFLCGLILIMNLRFCGLDFAKAVPIELKDIDTTHSPIIRQHEFNVLKGKDYRVTQRFKHFIKKFDYAKLHPTLPDSKVLLKYSTLQYFEKELEQKKKIKLTISKQNSTLSL